VGNRWKIENPRASGPLERLWTLLAVVGFVSPIALYLWLISADGIDMVRADQWFDVKLIHEWSGGTLSLGDLWAQHGENRVLFQNLITLALARFFHYNVLFEEYLSAILLVAALALLVLAHHRRSPSTPWLWYCPVAFLLLTVAQWGGTLYGYSLGWYLIVVCLAVLLFLLDNPTLSWIGWTGAGMAAVIASFSSLQGLFVWGAGLSILLQRKRSKRMILAWLGTAVVTTALYFYGWDATQGNGVSYALGHLGHTLQYFFFAIGDVVSVPLPGSPHGAQYGVLLLGVAIFAVAIWSLGSHGFRVDEASARPLGVALIWVGLLFATAVAAARSEDGISNASFSLYVAFDLLILLGCLLVAIDRTQHDLAAPTKKAPFALSLKVAVGALVLVQVLAGTANGLTHAREYRGYEVTGAVVDAKIHQAPDGLVESQLGAGYETATFIRRMTAYAQSEHLSLFSTGQVDWYRSQQIPKNTTPQIVVLGKPQAGEVLHGVTFLDAAASDPFGVTAVRFFGRQSGDGPRFLIGQAVRSPVGWLGRWDTERLPNGTYLVEALASSPGGLQSSNSWVRVQLSN
jgi:hypothetical protein